MHADKPDILVNLNGYTKGSRNEVFALRPAPIQIMYMGFPGSSGASYMHYLVTDAVVSPPRLGHLYTEKLAYMPNSYFVNDHKQCFADINKHVKTDAEVNEIRAKYGLPPRPTVVLCCFNQLYKIEPITFQMWIGILLRVPDSILWLLRFPKEGECNIRAQAEKLGLPKDRLVFTNVAQKAEHVARSVAADIFLDTPLCNAHTTGTDVLWSGTPIVTMPLENMASRVAASLLAASDCQELVASDIEDYQRKVMDLATNLPRLRALQRRLHSKRCTSRLFDTKMWISDFEDLLSAVIEDFAAGGLTTTHDIPVRAMPTDQPPQCKRVRLCD